jgi:hypothetical protein
MNYADLRQAIIDYTETDESIFVQNIPTFVEQAEERIYNTVQIPALRRNVTGNVTATNKYLACPDDFLSVFSLAAVDATGRYEYLLNKDVNFIRQAYPNPNSTGLPRYYALFGPRSGNSTELSFILGPTPDAAYTMELHYFYYPESIVTAGTSWLGDNYSPVLLYGALREAYLFQKGEADLISNVEAKYNEALQQLNRLGTGLERGDAYRDGQAKIKVNP